jgi:hypothetical protein
LVITVTMQEEFVDTVNHVRLRDGSGWALALPTAAAKTTTELLPPDASGGMADMVDSYVRMVMCGPGWEDCMLSELDRVAARWRGCMLRLLRAYKARSPGVLPVIPDVVACVAAEAGTGR